AGGPGAAPDLVKVNRAEAGVLVGGDAPVPDLLAAVRERTGGLVVITDGADGAWGTDGDRVLRTTLDGHTGGFPVGSGDSFLGGLLVALDRGDDLAAALALATATGTANAQVPGAAVLDADLARRLAGRVTVSG
ncbi:1-phosphofructokinase family hexose kinase, partial [Promicromonospora citrea]